MNTILITGAGPTGVTGRAIREYLEDSYEILAPSSKELDLTDDEAVRAYFDSHHIDFVVHCATYRSNISQTTHLVDDEFESNLRMYFNLAVLSDKFQKMVYLGSGAEYDKSRPIVNISEDQFGECIPKDKYGFGKYIMNQRCRNSKNIYNLRMFGTLNKYERYTKNVISNICAKAIMNMPLNLRQDCRFSWVDILDISKAIHFLFEHEVERHDYNIAVKSPYLLSEMACLIRQLAKVDQEVTFQQTGLSNEYTCSTEKFETDFGFCMRPIGESINEIYDYILSNKETINIEAMDGRWK